MTDDGTGYEDDEESPGHEPTLVEQILMLVVMGGMMFMWFLLAILILEMGP
jgi:hypothetical protein